MVNVMGESTNEAICSKSGKGLRPFWAKTCLNSMLSLKPAWNPWPDHNHSKVLEYFQNTLGQQKYLVYFNVRLNKTCAVLCENGASSFSTGSVWVISNISTSSKTILNKTPHFARPWQPCCVQLEADRSISWRVILTNLAPSREHCSSFSSVETNKRQFSFWLLLFWKVVGGFFCIF